MQRSFADVDINDSDLAVCSFWERIHVSFLIGEELFSLFDKSIDIHAAFLAVFVRWRLYLEALDVAFVWTFYLLIISFRFFDVETKFDACKFAEVFGRVLDVVVHDFAVDHRLDLEIESFEWICITQIILIILNKVLQLRE